ncbi:hypothetical protein U9M48_044792 [Paspalum notatum var. saurae]|uniref:Uncharacterized protein n=1 Tax=Paspalum notatum var. saurae TaxID=547442 RepID=A0AAQ3UVS1_PASNO
MRPTTSRYAPRRSERTGTRIAGKVSLLLLLSCLQHEEQGLWCGCRNCNGVALDFQPKATDSELEIKIPTSLLGELSYAECLPADADMGTCWELGMWRDGDIRCFVGSVRHQAVVRRSVLPDRTRR